MRLVIDPRHPQGVRAATHFDKKTVPTEQYAKLVSKDKVRVGCIVEFQRSFKFFSVSGFLGGLLKLFNRKWDGYGWHVAWVTSVEDGNIKIIEAAPGGVREVHIDSHFYKDDRNYRFWDLGLEPTPQDVKAIVKKHEGLPYNYESYFWIALVYIFRHYWNRPIPKLLDNQYLFWELVINILRDLDKPIGQGDYDLPLLTDLNLFCRGLLNLSEKEQVKYHDWRKSHSRLGVDKTMR